jgi:hypothetical protein
VGYRGTGTKSPDIWAIPLCRQHHDELHADRPAFESKYGTQYELVALTFAALWLRGEVTLGDK